MKIRTEAQGTPEWYAARMGCVTASQAHRIVTPKTRKLSTGSEGYMHELLAEWMLGHPVNESKGGEQNPFMQRGKEMEPEAVAWYEFNRDVTTEVVGFCTNDEGTIGASPDRLVGEDGLLEVKCPSAAQHVANMLSMTDDYMSQVQFQMLVTERQWCDLLSYNPAMPPVVKRIERDADFIDLLNNALFGENGFIERMEWAKRRIVELGYMNKIPQACQIPILNSGPCGSMEGVSTIDGIATCAACAKELEAVFG